MGYVEGIAMQIKTNCYHTVEVNVLVLFLNTNEKSVEVEGQVVKLLHWG